MAIPLQSNLRPFVLSEAKRRLYRPRLPQRWLSLDAFSLLAAIALLTIAVLLGAVPAGADEPRPYRIIGDSIPEPLTGEPGNPARGRQVVRDQSNATCLLCHALPISEETDHGNLGPPLAGIGNRYSAGQLRLRLVDPKVLNPASMMPAYYRNEPLHRVMQRFANRPIYTAQQIEDVVAYLVSLKQSETEPGVPSASPRAATGKSQSGYAFLDATTRSLQDDDFQNPGNFALEDGKALWSRVEGSEGKSCASCHAPLEQSMRGVAARYPVYDADRKGLVSVEMRINEEREKRMKAKPFGWDSRELLALTSLLTSQSRGMPINVRIDGPARPFFEQGQQFYGKRRGQFDLSCAQCHEGSAGQRLRGDVISQGQINGFPVYRLTWQSIASRHRLFAWCNTSVRAEPYASGSDEYLTLELYLAWRGRGISIESPAVRR